MASNPFIVSGNEERRKMLADLAGDTAARAKTRADLDGDSAARDKVKEDLKGDQKERERVVAQLAAAKAPWQADGKGLRGSAKDTHTIDEKHKPALRLPLRKIERGTIQPPFPQQVVEEVTQQTGGTPTKISFLLTNATTPVDGTPVHRIKVEDGKINGQFPDGMGFGNYILTPGDPNDGIVVAGITFTVSTLEITSRFLDLVTAGSYPENEIDEDEGTIYWQIGFCWMDGDTFNVLTTHPGDINLAFTFGSNNGKPGLLPIESTTGWLDMASFFET